MQDMGRLLKKYDEMGGKIGEAIMKQEFEKRLREMKKEMYAEIYESVIRFYPMYLP
jgi:hypothetical protein